MLRLSDTLIFCPVNICRKILAVLLRIVIERSVISVGSEYQYYVELSVGVFGIRVHSVQGVGSLTMFISFVTVPCHYAVFSEIIFFYILAILSIIIIHL
jgi:hypothetical protein